MQIPFVICAGIFLLLIVVISIIWVHYRGISPLLWILIAAFPKYRLYFTLVDCLNLLQQGGMCYTEWLGQYSHYFEVKESDGRDIADVKTFISKTLQDSDFIFSHFSKINKKGVRRFIKPSQLTLCRILRYERDWGRKQNAGKGKKILEPHLENLQLLIDNKFLTKDFEPNLNEDDKNRRRKAYILLEKIVDLCNINDKDKDAIAYLWGFLTVSDLSVNSKEDYDEQAEKDFNDYENKLDRIIRLIKDRDAIKLLGEHRKVLQPLIDGGYLTKNFEPNLNEDDKKRQQKAKILLEKIVDLCNINDKDKDAIARFWGFLKVSDLSVNSKEDYDEQAEKDFNDYENKLEKVIRRIKGHDAIKLLEPHRDTLLPLIESDFLTEHFELNVNEDDNNRRRKAKILFIKIVDLCQISDNDDKAEIAYLWGFQTLPDLPVNSKEDYDEQADKDFKDYENKLEHVIKIIKGSDAITLLDKHREVLQPLIDNGYLTKDFKPGDKINEEHRYHKTGYLMKVIAKLCTFKNNDGYATKLAPFWGYKSVSALTTAANESLDESKTKGNLDDMKKEIKELTDVYITKSEKKAEKKQ